jgi:hypothetical protein
VNESCNMNLLSITIITWNNNKLRKTERQKFEYMCNYGPFLTNVKVYSLARLSFGIKLILYFLRRKFKFKAYIYIKGSF